LITEVDEQENTMKRLQFALPVILALFAFSVLAATFFDGAVRSHADDVPKEPVAAPVPKFKFLGIDNCEGCHTAPGRTTHQDLCRLNEAPIFFDEDKHSLAWENLSPKRNPLAASMQKALEPVGFKDITSDRRCLSCHATWHKDAETKPDFYQYGVQCEACHGPGSDWEVPHKDVEWRLKTPEEKAELGMIDVRDPVTRAKQCFSCHVGDPSEGKVVTHDMYAAGHPPLPSVEVESFVDQMPGHWRYLQEKGNFVNRKEFVKANFPDWPHDPATDLPRTRNIIVSGVVAMQSSTSLLSHESAKPTSDWPELAVFDCNSCHHDLKQPSWRQDRGYANRAPGRPPMTGWPTVLVRLGIRQVAGADDAKYEQGVAKYDGLLKKLDDAVTAQPFGNRSAIAAASKEIDSWLTGLVDAVSRSHYDQAAAKRALAHLLNVEATGNHDFHSARQLAWAVKMIAIEAEVAYPTEWPERPEDEIRHNDREKKELALLDTWEKEVWTPREQAVDAVFETAGLNKGLFLKLPAGQKYRVDDEMPKTLAAISTFDPNWFKTAMGQVRAELAK